MYDLVIACTTCGAERSTSHLVDKPALNAPEVLAQAGHTPQCPIKRTGGFVTQEPRPDEPEVVIYVITEKI